MEDGNQADEAAPPPAGRDAEREAAGPGAEPGSLAPAPAPPAGLSIARGLLFWLIVLVVLGLGGLAAGIQELSAMVAFAGIFVAAQAADVDPRWYAPYVALGAVVPIGGAAAFVFLASDLLRGDTPEPLRSVATAFAIVSAAFSLMTLEPRIARGLSRVIFRSAGDSHTLHLSARVVALTLLIVFPGAVALPQLLEPVLERPGGLFESGSLGGELVGYVVLALAAVGFLVRRDLRATLERLGLRRPRVRDLGLIAAGAGALFLINGGAEWLQHRLFPGTWAHDRQVNEELVRGLNVRAAMLLGVTAGVGEEITVRGALQPRLGIVLTSTVFAALHVQYSWYGMLTILMIGLVLGVLRQRAGTTVTMGVHALYDMLAVFTT
jgi:hypothetical protein